MITYAEATSAIWGVVCSRCLHAELSAVLYLEEGSECVCSAHCEHCGANFIIEFAKFETLADVQRRVETGLRAAACAVCGQVNYALSLKCEQPSKDCYFEARCRACGVVYRVETRHSQIDLVRLKA